MSALEKLTVAVVVCIAATACGPADEGPSPVETDLEVPEGQDFHVKLSGPVSDEITAQGANRTPRSDEEGNNTGSRIRLTGPSFSLMANIEAKEGETGTWETVDNVQVTHGPDKFYNSAPLRVTLDKHADGEIAGAVAGELDKQGRDEDAQSWDPPLSIEGAFEFTY